MNSVLANAPDRAALRALGERVRGRVAANSAVYRIDTDKAEIFAVGDFLTAEECARLCAMTDAVAEPSKLYDQGHAEAFRTSFSGDFDPFDPFVRGISRRIDDLLGIDPAWGETIQGQRYLPGQQFKPHNDWFYPDQPYWQGEVRRGGQRSWTAMAFLNEVEAGGETDFTHVGLRITPKPGALLFWNNARPDGIPNEDTMHAGTPVERGVKYVITKWYRTRNWT